MAHKRTGRGAAVLVVGLLLAAVAGAGAYMVIDRILPKPADEPTAEAAQEKDAADAAKEPAEPAAPRTIDIGDVSSLTEIELPEPFAACLVLAEYNTLRSDLADVSRMSGAKIVPNLDLLVNLYGLDRGRPAGVVGLVHEDQVLPIGMLPIRDRTAFWQAVTRFLGEPVDHQGGKQAGPLFFLPLDNYVLVGQETEIIRQVKDPEEMLRGTLGKSRLVGVVHSPRIPQALRDRLETFADATADDVDAASVTEQLQSLRRSIKMYEALTQLNESERAVVRVDFDDDRGLSLLSLTQPLPGTDLAKAYAANQQVTNRFLGAILQPNLFWVAAAERSTADALDLQAFDELAEEIAAEFKDDQQQEWTALVEDLQEFLKQLARLEQGESMLAHMPQGDHTQLLFAVHVNQPRSADALIRRALPFLESAGYLSQVKLEAAREGEIVVHAMRWTLPARAQDREILRAMFGEEPALLIACSADAVWGLVGPAEPKLLLAAIARAKAAPAADASAMQMEINFSQMLQRFGALPGLEFEIDAAGEKLLAKGDAVRMVRRHTAEGEVGYVEVEIGIILWLVELAGRLPNG